MCLSILKSKKAWLKSAKTAEKGFRNLIAGCRLMMIAWLFLLLFLLSCIVSLAQEKYVVSGSISAQRTGEKVMGASISARGSFWGTTSNEYGFYSLALPKGSHTVIISAVGLVQKQIEVVVDGDLKLNISLEEKSGQLEGVVVSARSGGRSLSSSQMGMERLNTQAIKTIPVLLGERDVLKTIQLLPGIKSAGEGSSGFYVRGGAADQNLILLDGAPVYNASHLLGFFSTFNSDAIKDITVYKGGMPAQYGGRLSSVVDVMMNEGNNQHYAVSGGLGLISSRLNIEGPIQKDQSSFLISARRTYADLFLKLSSDSSINKNRLYFYDLNAKLNYKLGKADHLYLSGYFGRDVLGFQNQYGIDWGNGTGTLRWNHIFNPKLFSNTSLIYSNYNYKVNVVDEKNDFDIFSQIRDWNLKQEFQWFAGSRSNIRFGLNSIYRTIRPGEVRSSETSSIADFFLQKRYSWENAAYISNSWKASSNLNLSYGLRVTAFSILGAGKFYNLDGEGNVTDTLSYSKGEVVKTYVNLEPRLAVSYRLNHSSSIKVSYVRNVQNLHLISNSTSTSPTDKWVTSTNTIRPGISDQVSMGYYKNLAGSKYELTVEAYYKSLQNQIDYRNGADIYTKDAIESQLLFGKGRAYGIEWLLKKSSGRFTGWLSYTLSRTERSFDDIDHGHWFAAKQDRTHDLALVGNYKLNNKWTLSANWVFYTGDAVTFPAGKYTIDGRVVFYYTQRNGYRMPNYHRLDLGATMQLKSKGRYTSDLSFSLYNAYGRENAYTIEFRQSEKDPDKTEAVQTALFKYIPSITYNFKF